MGGAIAMDLGLRHAARVEALILSCTAAKFNMTPGHVEGLRAITMGRAPQAFNTDGYSSKTVKENFDVVREGWMERSHPIVLREVERALERGPDIVLLLYEMWLGLVVSPVRTGAALGRGRTSQ